MGSLINSMLLQGATGTMETTNVCSSTNMRSHVASIPFFQRSGIPFTDLISMILRFLSSPLPPFTPLLLFTFLASSPLFLLLTSYINFTKQGSESALKGGLAEALMNAYPFIGLDKNKFTVIKNSILLSLSFSLSLSSPPLLSLPLPLSLYLFHIFLIYVILEKYFLDKANRRRFLDEYATEKRFDPLVPENWYGVQRDDVIKKVFWEGEKGRRVKRK